MSSLQVKNEKHMIVRSMKNRQTSASGRWTRSEAEFGGSLIYYSSLTDLRTQFFSLLSVIFLLSLLLLTPWSLVWIYMRDANGFSLLLLFLYGQIVYGWARGWPVYKGIWIKWSLGQSAMAKGCQPAMYPCRWRD